MKDVITVGPNAPRNLATMQAGTFFILPLCVSEETAIKFNCSLAIKNKNNHLWMNSMVLELNSNEFVNCFTCCLKKNATSMKV